MHFFTRQSRTSLLGLLILCSLALLIRAPVPVKPDAGPVKGQGSSLRAPTPAGISHLLWPGVFEVAGEGNAGPVSFTASGRRYRAMIRSDGFSVAAPAESSRVAIRLLGATNGIAAEFEAPKAGVFNEFNGDAGLAHVTPCGNASLEA